MQDRHSTAGLGKFRSCKVTWELTDCLVGCYSGWRARFGKPKEKTKWQQKTRQDWTTCQNVILSQQETSWQTCSSKNSTGIKGLARALFTFIPHTSTIPMPILNQITLYHINWIKCVLLTCPRTSFIDSIGPTMKLFIECWVMALKIGWRGKFFWLIKISMSPNLPESNYSAIRTAKVPLNPC